RELDPRNRLFAGIETFARSVDVVENELIDPATVPGRFGEILGDYLDMLERYRLLTYGQQIVRAVTALEDLQVAEAVHVTLRHLIVDEYQDVNPAQERLIELLVSGGAELCVVGDDDQAIYQWRGSDVGNIVRFRDRYPDVAEFTISTNRRSRPEIIAAANKFATSIPNRLAKKMLPDRPPSDSGDTVVCWSADTAAEE
ncbi:MAG: ATP-dependent helicase, partial [Myxococcales bacterium]|nr:ATP-dependent helicase [Myxococcales bacterium]